MQIAVDSLRTQYERMGQKHQQTVLILPGWGDTIASWRELQTALAAVYDVIALDLPGFGGTEQPPVAWGFDEYAQFVAAFLKRIKCTKLYALIGHSNGGAIAVRGLANSVLTAERLVLLDCAGLRSEYRGHRKAARLLAKAGKALAAPLPRSLKTRVRHQAYRTIGSDVLIAEHMQQTFKRIVTDDIQESAATLQLPTLLLYGEADAQTPLQYGRILRSLIDGARLEVVANAGHCVHIDKPTETQRLVEGFLAP